MKKALAYTIGVLAAGLLGQAVQAQTAVRLSNDPEVVAMIRDAERRLHRAAAELGYAKQTLFLRVLAIESDAPRAVGTMSGIGVAKIHATGVRRAGLTADEVAWVIAHEFAHFILNHPSGSAMSDAFPSDASGDATVHRQRELEADSLGLVLARKAGYSFDPHAFFVKLRGGRLAGEGTTHPADEVRVRAMLYAVAGA